MTILANARRRMCVAMTIAGVVFATLPITHASAQDLIKVKVGDTTSLAQLGMYAGIQKGIFKKHGLDVERIAMPGGAKVLTTLLTGDIDIGYLAASTRSRPNSRTGRSRSSACRTTWKSIRLLGRNDLKGKINKPADLKDRTIGISSIGSGSWAFAKFLAHLRQAR